LAQNDPNSIIARPATDRQGTILNETTHVTNTHGSDNREVISARQQSFATILVGQSALLLEGLKRILEKTHFQVVALRSTVDELDLCQAQQHRTLLLILDAGHDLEMAVRQIKLFKQQRPDARVAILAETDRMADIALLFRSGANAFFPNTASTPSFLKSLELVMMGETFLPSRLLSSIQDPVELPTPAQSVDSSGAHLSAQEQRVLSSLVEGRPNKTIAKELGIAVSTVTVHIKAILRKIGAQNRTQAAIWAVSHGGSDCGMRSGPPEPSLAAIERPSPAASPSAQEESPMAENGSLGDVNEEVMTPTEDAQEIEPKGTFVQQRSNWRSERRLAEDAERRNGIVASINRLRELRKARDSSAR